MGPPRFLTALGIPYILDSTYEQLRSELPAFPSRDALSAITEGEALRIYQFEAPRAVFGGDPSGRPPDFDSVIAASEGDVSEYASLLKALYQRVFTPPCLLGFLRFRPMRALSAYSSICPDFPSGVRLSQPTARAFAFQMSTNYKSPMTPEQALQRTGAAVKPAASCLRLSPTAQRSRQPRRSLSLGSLGDATRAL